MRPKSRGLARHGGSPGCLKESDPAGCDFERDGRPMPPALTEYITWGWSVTNVHRHGLRHARKAWPGILVDPCLLSDSSYRIKDPGDGGGGGGVARVKPAIFRVK